MILGSGNVPVNLMTLEALNDDYFELSYALRKKVSVSPCRNENFRKFDED